MPSTARPARNKGTGQGKGPRSPRYLPPETPDLEREARRVDNGILAFDRRELDEARRYITILTAAARWESAQALELSRQLLDVRLRPRDDDVRD